MHDANHDANLGLELLRPSAPPIVSSPARLQPNARWDVLMQPRLRLGRRSGRENLHSPPVSLRQELQPHRRWGLLRKVSAAFTVILRPISSRRLHEIDASVGSVIQVSELISVYAKYTPSKGQGYGTPLGESFVEQRGRMCIIGTDRVRAKLSVPKTISSGMVVDGIPSPSLPRALIAG